MAAAKGTVPPNAGKGRPKGVQNKATVALKDAILMAAAEVGLDGKGKDGLKGYLRTLARTERKAYAGLLGRVLPLQITGEGDAPIFVGRIELVAPDVDRST